MKGTKIYLGMKVVCIKSPNYKAINVGEIYTIGGIYTKQDEDFIILDEVFPPELLSLRYFESLLDISNYHYIKITSSTIFENFSRGKIYTVYSWKISERNVYPRIIGDNGLLSEVGLNSWSSWEAVEENECVNFEDKKINDSYHDIVERTKNGFIFGKQVKDGDVKTLVVAAYHLGMQEEIEKRHLNEY